jgi:ribokinase
MAFLGNDQPGKDYLKYIHQEGVDTSTMVAHENMKSNYYYVLRYGADRTILVKNEEYDYVWVAPEKTPDWIYLSLLSEASWQLHEDMLAYLDVHPDTKLAFQPGTFHFKWGVEKLSRVYARSYIVVMNREEAVDVTGESYDSLKQLARALHALGPKVVVITDGPNGSFASYDGKLVSIPNYPDPAPPLDRTGAGDAFASTIVAALARGESIETALTWAPINSMSVVQKLGAQAGLLKLSDINQYLQTAPEYYHPEELN